MTRIIDFHTHPWLPADLAPATAGFIRDISPAVRDHGDRLSDPVYFADTLRAQGVERAVVLPEHCPRTSGNVRTDTVIDFCARVPDFLLPFASIDINTDADAPALLRHYLAVAPIRGLKLYPSYQFYYPNDPRLYPVYELCQRAGIPVLLHIGSSVIPGTRIRYCDPLYLDDVAVDFPDLTVVMAHGGRGFWYDVCAFLAVHKPNFYIDVAGLVPASLPSHYPDLGRLIHKMVFGSDWPAMPKSVEANIAALRNLGLPAEGLEMLLYRNAERILGLTRG